MTSTTKSCPSRRSAKGETSALAWTAIADHHIFRAIRGMTSPAESAREALSAARIALKLDPNLPDAHVSMGATLSHSGDVANAFST